MSEEEAAAAPEFSLPMMETKIRNDEKLTLFEAVELFKRMYPVGQESVELFIKEVVNMQEDHPHLFPVWKGLFISFVNPIFSKDYVFRGSYQDVKVLTMKTGLEKPGYGDQKYRVTFNSMDNSIIISKIEEKPVANQTCVAGHVGNVRRIRHYDY